MYDFIYRRKRLVQLILALITLPFAFFGVDYYFRNDTGPTGEVATVAGERITQGEFSDNLRVQQDRLRQTMQRNFDPTIFDNPEVRYSVLDQLIGRRLLQKQAQAGRLTVSDDQVRQFISDIPAFQEGGKFSQARYEQLLDMQNPRKSPVEFAADVRRELMLAPLQEPIANGGIVARSSVERYLGLLEQQREVAVAAMDPESYLKEVKIDDAAVKTFYDANQAALQEHDEVKMEYVLLSPDTLGAQTPVDPDEVKKQYEANMKAYGKPEERQAAHILIAVKPEASAADKEAAKKKADDVALQAKKNPAQFAEL